MADAMAGMKMMGMGMNGMGNMRGGMMSGMRMDEMMKKMQMMGGKMMNGMGMNLDGLKEMMMDSGKGIKDNRRSSEMACDSGVAMARMNAKECEGKTVRQLSRFWRYAGGCKPTGEGTGMMNCVGLGFSGMDVKMANGMMINGDEWRYGCREHGRYG